MTSDTAQTSNFINSKNRSLFAQDVLNILQKRRITFRGCLADYVAIFMDGRVKVWFFGMRDRRAWRGGVSFNCVIPQERVYMADPAIVAEMCATHIAAMKAE